MSVEVSHAHYKQPARWASVIVLDTAVYNVTNPELKCEDVVLFEDVGRGESCERELFLEANPSRCEEQAEGALGKLISNHSLDVYSSQLAFSFHTGSE